MKLINQGTRGSQTRNLKVLHSYVYAWFYQSIVFISPAWAAQSDKLDIDQKFNPIFFLLSLGTFMITLCFIRSLFLKRGYNKVLVKRGQEIAEAQIRKAVSQLQKFCVASIILALLSVYMAWSAIGFSKALVWIAWSTALLLISSYILLARLMYRE